MTEKYSPSPEEMEKANHAMTEGQFKNSVERAWNLEGKDRGLLPDAIAKPTINFSYDPVTKVLRYFDGTRNQYGDSIWKSVTDIKAGISMLERYIPRAKQESQDFIDRLEELKLRIERESGIL